MMKKAANNTRHFDISWSESKGSSAFGNPAKLVINITYSAITRHYMRQIYTYEYLNPFPRCHGIRRDDCVLPITGNAFVHNNIYVSKTGKHESRIKSLCWLRRGFQTAFVPGPDLQRESIVMGNCLQGQTSDDISLLHDETEALTVDRRGPPPPYRPRVG